MWRLSLKNVWSRKGRLLLTALAIIAGTAFLSGVFIFTNTMQSSFDSMFADAYRNVDAVVRSSDTIKGEVGETNRNRIDAGLLDAVRAIPGVTSAGPIVQGPATITVRAKVIGTDGPPKFGANFDDAPTSPFRLVEGTAPQAGQVVIDRGSAKDGSIQVGDTLQVSTNQGTKDFVVSGIVSFAGNDSSLGATWALFDLATAQQFVTGEPGKLDGITVRGDGSTSDAELATRVAGALTGRHVEVKTGAEITKENQDQVAKVLNIITVAFSVFALISLFVGSFIIYNVFSISAAQRTQENALLRAVGASRSQVTRSMFVEALVVGIGGSLLGCVAGIGLAFGIMKLMSSLGFLNNPTLSLEPSGFLITLIVGVLVTLVCAIAPAIRAGRVPPLAAMRDVATDRSDVSRRRLVGGVATLVAAVLCIVAGLGGRTTFLGLGTGLLFITLIVLGPLLAGPFVRLCTPLMARIRPVAGAIAGRNAARNPKRTALTAGALAIVVALFIGVATLGSSAKATVGDTFRQAFVSDYTVTSKGGGGGSSILLPPTLAADLEAAKVGTVMAVAGVPIEIDGSRVGAIAIDGAVAATMMTGPFRAGGFAGLTPQTVVISVQESEERQLGMGDTLNVKLVDGSIHPLRIVGLYDRKQLGAVFIDRQLVAGTSNPVFQIGVWINTDGSAASQQAMQAVVDRYPTAKLFSRDDFIASRTKSVDGFLNLIYGLLGMSMFIAIVGIVITLLLAVYERRRELGLVRAVGMTRRQVRSSVLWESLVTALIGVALGIALGVALGWIIVVALRDQGLSSFRLPVGTIVVAAVGALVLAAVASFLPARRAAKADILQAIATT